MEAEASTMRHAEALQKAERVLKEKVNQLKEAESAIVKQAAEDVKRCALLREVVGAADRLKDELSIGTMKVKFPEILELLSRPDLAPYRKPHPCRHTNVQMGICTECGEERG